MGVIKKLELPIAFGIKNRDWKTGEILGLAVMGADVSGKNVLIVDDICSKGFTFYYAGQQLIEHGAKDVRLYVTHCEDNIQNGEVLKTDVISKVYTTDSICHIENEKIEFIKTRLINIEEDTEYRVITEDILKDYEAKLYEMEHAVEWISYNEIIY